MSARPSPQSESRQRIPPACLASCSSLHGSGARLNALAIRNDEGEGVRNARPSALDRVPNCWSAAPMVHTEHRLRRSPATASGHRAPWWTCPGRSFCPSTADKLRMSRQNVVVLQVASAYRSAHLSPACDLATRPERPIRSAPVRPTVGDDRRSWSGSAALGRRAGPVLWCILQPAVWGGALRGVVRLHDGRVMSGCWHGGPGRGGGRW
jgi:hypothetical protein